MYMEIPTNLKPPELEAQVSSQPVITPVVESSLRGCAGLPYICLFLVWLSLPRGEVHYEPFCSEEI